MAIDRNDNSKSNSAQNNDNGQHTPRKANITEDVAILNDFLKIIQQKFTATVESSPTSDSDDNGRQRRLESIDEMYKSPAYAAEKNLLAQFNNNGITKGLAVGIGTFVFLRAGPGTLRRFFQRKHFSKSSGTGGYKFDNSAAHHMIGSQPNNPPLRSPQPGFIFRSIRFGLDCFLSLSMATYGSMYFVDRRKLMEVASSIPLVEGRSMVSDELCDDYTNLYRSIPQKTWEKYDGKSVPLDTISIFVKNCIKRKMAERQILEQERGFGASDTNGVEIPSPGVPADTQIEIVWNDFASDAKTNVEWDSQSDSMPTFDDSSSLASFPGSDQATETNFNGYEFGDNHEKADGIEHNNDERRWS